MYFYKQIKHPKAAFIHMREVIYHSLMRSAGFESQAVCFGRNTLIPMPHLYEEQKAKVFEWNVEGFYLLFFL